MLGETRRTRASTESFNWCKASEGRAGCEVCPPASDVNNRIKRIGTQTMPACGVFRFLLEVFIVPLIVSCLDAFPVFPDTYNSMKLRIRVVISSSRPKWG